jgi:hypothetical protein
MLDYKSYSASPPAYILLLRFARDFCHFQIHDSLASLAELLILTHSRTAEYFFSTNMRVLLIEMMSTNAVLVSVE